MHNASILVTGGTGSFGRAFVSRVLKENPARVAVFSRDEQKQDQMAAEVGTHPALRFFIGDVRDQDRLEMAMRGVDIVVHAAALKIVPILEYNPFEAIKTNVIGAQNVINAAIRSGVKQVVALSTDKASAPLNLYGASKLCSEKLFCAAHAYAKDDTTFAVARYGNVSGSRGSVIPAWAKMLAEGRRTLPVTSPFCTRFWLTLDDAVDLVFWTLDTMQGGELVVPELPAYQVSDLVEAMGGRIDVVGLRAGEKIHETMISDNETPQFARAGRYWVTGREGERLTQALSSETARRMSVPEIRSRLATLGFCAAEPERATA